VRSLGVERPGVARVFDLDDGTPPRGGVVARIGYSGISAGTELTYLKGTNPFLHAALDRELGVFRHGAPAQSFPVRSMGYMEVGRVECSDTPAISPGELVALACGHRTAHAADPAREPVVAVPPVLEPILGIYLAQMGPICANGLLHAAAEAAGADVRGLGDGVRGRSVLVTGAGVVGLLTALFARHHGADAVAVADTSPRRLDAAEALGLTPIDERAVPAWRHCKERWRHGPGDRGADVVFQCRGRAAALHGALRALRPQGTAIDLAFHQGAAEELRLGEEFHHNGLTIRCAQIGRVPRGLAGAWDRQRLAAETIDLLRVHGDAVRRNLITDLVALDEAPALLADVAARRREVIQAVVDMRSGDEAWIMRP
jgi:NADPH:quinone reductase-like Zn-dependent oxidoreductase